VIRAHLRDLRFFFGTWWLLKRSEPAWHEPCCLIGEVVGPMALYFSEERFMKIQTRLFVGTAALVLSLMAIQWWLYSRQLRSIEQELTAVATSVGEGMLTAERIFITDEVMADSKRADGGAWVEREPEASEGEAAAETVDPESPHVRVMRFPPGAEHEDMLLIGGTTPEDVVHQRVEVIVQDDEGEGTEGEQVVQQYEWRQDSDGEVTARVRRLRVEVEPGEKRSDRFLVVKEDDRRLHRIPIPTSPTVERVQSTMREGAAVGGALLAVGLLASAALSRRLTSPLRDLADGVEAVGQGDLGVEVPVSASGEVGELQRSFNLMSHRLQELESEREEWRKREHLAQLGDLSRGLAHTLRNPLHTLGLAVEELAGEGSERRHLVETSRHQIRRIDRWLRSFLALGAGESSHAESTNLHELAGSVVLESVQQGAKVTLEGATDVFASVVPGAIRAALANLVENAVDVSPDDAGVVVSVQRLEDHAEIRVADRGPGLPTEVRERLFSPHVTTKVGGSGMGLFLARQLVVGMHGGELLVEDRDGGGTAATLRVAAASAPVAEDGADG
jgi:signal transduction histidine kinase